ncbi:transposase IS116/IS110/IS902 family protein [Pontibacter ummariensis]|uniref:Transposase IS116/IS110/IS902 family protein n=1 Tax=Pontibacter ummariensis TaxID=1610492 RepID=A0A239L741_9BACT|nr:transposase [Pontibacter ummariensis]PRY04289.1 transposase IS116/IS110/IS902 family protein [Pontibacter ummariensis]SNT25822.1 Transposase IS116/IS110/IS902 family protein [Pontibacter ummariensis]
MDTQVGSPLVELVVNMEATGVYYEALAWIRHQQGRKVNVVLANLAKKYFQSLGYKSKNDRLDAKALAHMGAERSLEPWQPLSKQLYLLRKLTREHEQIQRVHCETANRLHAETFSMHTGKSTVKRLQKTLQLYDKQLQAVRQEIKATVEKDALLREKISKVTTIKGVGLLTAATIIAETNGFALFTSQKQLVSYVGYEVVENQSATESAKPGSPSRATATSGRYCTCRHCMRCAGTCRCAGRCWSGSGARERKRCWPMWPCRKSC